MLKHVFKDLYKYKILYSIFPIFVSIFMFNEGDFPMVLINITLENLPSHITYLISYFTSLTIFHFIGLYIRNAISFSKWKYDYVHINNPLNTTGLSENEDSILWYDETSDKTKIYTFIGLNLNKKYLESKLREDNINKLLT